ncbi:hypothetical protein BKA69DRAFT_1042179 [Paraphysoderma sedebokerense]|nr:hypothetical protein BKA69DRAFT_1042179 [Paraphysoderma sedebokerense]
MTQELWTNEKNMKLWEDSLLRIFGSDNEISEKQDKSDAVRFSRVEEIYQSDLSGIGLQSAWPVDTWSSMRLECKYSSSAIPDGVIDYEGALRKQIGDKHPIWNKIHGSNFYTIDAEEDDEVVLKGDGI